MKGWSAFSLAPTPQSYPLFFLSKIKNKKMFYNYIYITLIILEDNNKWDFKNEKK